jgi:hypothetical protein
MERVRLPFAAHHHVAQPAGAGGIRNHRQVAAVDMGPGMELERSGRLVDAVVARRIGLDDRIARVAGEVDAIGRRGGGQTHRLAATVRRLVIAAVEQMHRVVVLDRAAGEQRPGIVVAALGAFAQRHRQFLPMNQITADRVADAPVVQAAAGLVAAKLQMEQVRLIAALQIPCVPHAHAGRVIQPRLLLRRNPGHGHSAKHRVTVLPVQNQPPFLDACIADQLGGGKRLHEILRLCVLEVPPGPRLGIGRLVGLGRAELFHAQSTVVDAGVVNRPGKKSLILGLKMSEAEHRDAVGSERLRRSDRVLRIRRSVAIDRDLIPTIDEGHLHQRIRIGGLRDVGGLVLLRATKPVAPGHPLRGRDLTEYDPVEVILLIFQRQHAAAALSEVRGSDPGNQRFILERALLVRLGER